MDDHFVLYWDTSEPGVRGLWNDADLDEQGYVGGRQYYEQLGSFLRAARLCLRHLDEDAFETRTDGIWPLKRKVRHLRPAVAEQMRREFGDADGSMLLPTIDNHVLSSSSTAGDGLVLAPTFTGESSGGPRPACGRAIRWAGRAPPRQYASSRGYARGYARGRQPS